MSIKSKLFYTALELLLKWVMKKKGGHPSQHFDGHKYYGKKPYYKKKSWFD